MCGARITGIEEGTHLLELNYLPLVVDSEAAKVDGLLLVELDHLSGSAEINDELEVLDKLAVSLNDSLLFIGFTFQLVELLPSIFRESDVKVLVTADLVQFLKLADVQLILQFFHLLALLLVLERGYGVGLGRLVTLSESGPCLRPHCREEPILKPFGHRGRFLQMSVIRRDCVENGRYRPDFFFRSGYSLRLMLTLAALLGPSLPFQLRDNFLDCQMLLQWVRTVLSHDDFRRLL